MIQQKEASTEFYVVGQQGVYGANTKEVEFVFTLIACDIDNVITPNIPADFTYNIGFAAFEHNA